MHMAYKRYLYNDFKIGEYEMKKRVISFLLTVVLMLTMFPIGGLTSFAATSGDFSYTVLSETDKTCAITYYSGSAISLTIPSQIDGYTVTQIGYPSRLAFYDNNSLVSVVIPDGVNAIVEHAFGGCKSLVNIEIPHTVTEIESSAFTDSGIYLESKNWENGILYIGDCLIDAKWNASGKITVKNGTRLIATGAFFGNSYISSVQIPISVNNIGDGAFTSMSNLQSITVEDENKSYSSMDGVLFNKDKTELVRYPSQKGLLTYNIPDNVKVIAKDAFYGADNLTAIVIPQNVTEINEDAFNSCFSLENVVLPNDITKINDRVFYNCTSLQEIVFPEKVLFIGNRAFEYCESLKNVVLSVQTKGIGEEAFSGCTNLTEISFPDNLAYISSGAFQNCRFTEITLPNSITALGDAVFGGCRNLQKVTLSNNYLVKRYNAAFGGSSYTYDGRDNISVICLTESVTNISGNHFYGDSLKQIIVSSGNSQYCSIDGILFSKDMSEILQYPCDRENTNYILNTMVTSIGEAAFYNCTTLTRIMIPDSVTSIGYEAFCGCTSLTSVTIPNSVTSIGCSAFYNCTSLTSITIPNSVTSIDAAFLGCISLTTIYGYSGSYAELYAKQQGYTFIDISTGTAISGTLTQNEITLSLFDKDAFIEGNVDFFGEHSASAQHRLNGVRLTAGSTQQDFDNAAVLKAAQRGETVVLSKNGYQKYTIPAEVVGSWFESDALAARNIYMTKDKKDGKPYISGAYAKENGKSVAYTDLQSEALTVMADTAYDILLTAETNGEAVQEYVLSQDDAHKLTSKNGVFSAKTLSKTFAAGKDVYAYVKTASGKTSAPVKVGLQITQLSLNTDTFSLVGQKGQTLTFAKDAPLVGNASLSLDGFTFPLGLEVEGNRFKISFGIDLFSVKKENDQLWGEKDGTKTWDFFKTNVRDLTSSVDSGTEKLKKFNNFYKTLAPNQSYNNKSQNFDTSFLGYAEGYLVDGKLVYTDFCGEVAAKFSFNYTQQGTIWVIPVYAYVKAGASAAIQLQSVRTLPDNDVPFDFGINLNITPSLTLGGGVGVKGAVSGGLYGKGSLPVAIQFMQQHANVKLTGEIGIEGECFCFSGKKTLVDGTITLCDKYYGKAKTAAVQNVLQRASQTTISDNAAVSENGTVTTVMSRDYAENTSKWLGTDYFKKFFAAKSTAADGLSVKELQTSVFKNSQTQLITLDNGKMMMAWIEDDSARDTYNRMRLVYSVYENGSWSKPKAVSDDGTNDAYPSLATDGTTVYIAWQNLKRSLTKTDADSIDAILKNSEICIAKYNAAKNQFENEKTLTNNVKYDYSPSLAVENAQAVLYWVQSADNNLSTAGSNTLYRYTTTDGTTTAVKSGLNYMPDMECAFVNGKDEVAFSMDTDGDLTTTGDIFAYTLANGILTQQTPNDETQSADFAVTYGMLNGQNTLFFADSTDVYYKQNGTVKKVFTSPRTVCGDLQVVENGTETNLLWTEISEAGTELWQCRCSDGVWSEPVQISNTGALLHDVSVVYHNGIIHGVFDRTARTQGNGEYVSGQTDLCYMTLTDYTDLEVSLITVDESTFTVGETAEIPVCLKNNGTQDISSVDLTLRDTLGTEITVNQAVDLPSGAETVAYVSYDVPQNYGQTTLTATAGIPNTEDINSANNTDSLEIGYANIAVSEISVNDIGEYFVLSAVVTNRNAVPVQNARVEICTDNEKGKLLEFATLGDLQPGEMRTVQYIALKSALQYDADNLAKICFSAKIDGEEKMTADNISYAVLVSADKAEPELMAGDVNTDGKITAVDARWALQAASGTRPLSNEQKQIADVNGDGQVTAVDARWILQAASGTRQL